MRRSLLLIVPLLVVVSSCYGVNPAGPDGSFGGGSGNPPSADFAFQDPAGDTLNPTSSELPRAVDALGLEGSMSADTLTIRLTFALPVTPWSEGGVGALDGYVDFDIDEDGTTGIASAVDLAGGSSGIGVDYYIGLRDITTNRATFVDVSDSSFVAVPMTIDGTTVTLAIPRSRFGDDDGNFRMNAVVGTTDREVTDLLPNTGFYAVHQP